VAINLKTLRDGEAAPPARPLTVSRTRTSRRILIDRVSSRLVVLGGIVVIASIRDVRPRVSAGGRRDARPR